MGHISLGIAHRLVEKGFVTGVRLEPMLSGDPVFCESCVYAKATRKSVLKAWEGERAKMFGEDVYSDLWGPAPVESKGGKRYYITYTDDCTCLTHLYLLHTKSDAFDSYKEYEAWCNQQLDVLIKVLYSNRGGEYCYGTAPYLIFYILLLFGLVDIIIRFKGGHMLDTW